jgi:4-carboxymuconolactone decarboxylase
MIVAAGIAGQPPEEGAMNRRELALGAAAAVAATATPSLPSSTGEMVMDNTRYERGLRNLAAIDGEAGRRVVDSLRDIAPDFARYVVEFPFGDIYNRPGLDLKSREIATIAALVALGNARPQLEVHLHGALNVGCTRTEIVEVLMQMAVYAGFPAALNGLFAAQHVFAERGA